MTGVSFFNITGRLDMCVCVRTEQGDHSLQGLDTNLYRLEVRTQ